MHGSFLEGRTATGARVLGRCVIAACGAAVLLAAHAGKARAQGDEATVRKIEQFYTEAAHYFEIGRTDKARERLEQVLDLDPNAEEAWNIIRTVGNRLMIQMMTDPQMGRAPRVLWELGMRHELREKRKASYVKPLVDVAIDPAQHPTERWKKIHELQEVGQFAVPFLADALGDVREHDNRAYARVAATRMGAQAVLPVIELLKASGEGAGRREALMCENAALILGDIGDERAIAALKRVAEDEAESEHVRRFAYQALLRITGMDPAGLPKAQQYYYEKADRYMREIAGVPAEAQQADGVVWKLVDGRLVDHQLPVYCWNEVMAEQACYDCLEIDPAFADIYPLLAEVLAAEIAEVRELVDISQEKSLGRSLSAEEGTDLKERDKMLARAVLLLNALGPGYVYAGLDKCLVDGSGQANRDKRALPRLAAIVLCEIAVSVDPHGDMLPKPGEVGDRRRGGRSEGGSKGAALIKALRYEDERVQNAAAIALAKINPPRPFEGAVDVVKTLGRAIGESGPLQILIVEEDPSIRNEIASKLRELDMSVRVVATAREGLAKAAGFPPYDVILVSPKLSGQDSTVWFLEGLMDDARSRPVPVAVITSYQAREADAGMFKTHQNVKGFVPIEDSGRELRSLVYKVASNRVFPIMTKSRAETVSIAAAEALAGMDPDHAKASGMDTAQCAEACIGALVNRSDAVRRPCIQALGKFKILDAAEKLVAIALDGGEALEIRQAAVEALGRIDPKAALDRLLDLAKSEDQEYIIRWLASWGYGIGAEGSPARAADFLKALKLPLGDAHAIEDDLEE